ncbi:MAG TPA: LamG domain-containing protein [Aquabacterium sp.]|nr:LamG domain-containing protein [Aquabacterium sp.]
MASLTCRFSLSLACGFTLAALSACGGGGSSSNSGAPASAQSADGRVSYTWTFEGASGSDGAVVRQFMPSKDGTAWTAGPITTCVAGAIGCRVFPVTDGHTGSALQFDPTANASFAWLAGGTSVSLCSSDLLEFSDPYGDLNYQMTVAMWIKPAKVESGQTYHLFGTGDPLVIGGTTYKAASFHVRMVDGKIVLSLFPGNGYRPTPDLVLTSATNFLALPTATAWHHVAVTYNNYDTRLYVDGQLEAQQTRGTDYRALCAAHRPYYLGGLSSVTAIQGVTEAASYIFPGTIDDLVFSNRAYSGSEIASLAASVAVK